MAKPEEIWITAVYLRERHRWDDTAIVSAWQGGADCSLAECEAGEAEYKDIAIKCTSEPGELRSDQEYQWRGIWTVHPKYGRQFHASDFMLKLPHGRQGVISYLRSAGEGLGFGPRRAVKCWEEWGSDAVETVRTNPQRAAEMLTAAGLRFSPEAAAQLAERLQLDAAVESCTLDLLDVLTGRGFPKATVRECIREWGNRASQVVRRDPYKLMRFRGCGFRRCDATWLELGLPPTRMKRQALAAWYAIARDSEGHTWFGEQMAVRGVQGNIAGAEVRPEKALRLAVRGKLLAQLTTNGAAGPVASNGSGTTRWVAEEKKAANERELAADVAEAMREGMAWHTCAPKT